MSTLAQVGRGAVLLTSMALVACYIDVYATGKFPWQHAAAETPATIPPPEFTSDPAVQQTQFVQAPADQQQRMFMAGSKSDVAASAIVVQSPTANTQTTTATTATPLFLSGSKSFTGQTTVLSGTLTPANPQADQKTPSFMGGSKTLMLPTRLPETSTTSPTQAVSPEKMQFMSGFKSPGPSVMQGATIPAPPPPPPIQNGSKLQGYPTTLPSNSNAPPTSLPTYDKPATTSPQFMSGSKSPFSRVPTPQQAAPPPAQQQTAPSKLPPLSPAGSY